MEKYIFENSLHAYFYSRYRFYCFQSMTLRNTQFLYSRTDWDRIFKELQKILDRFYVSADEIPLFLQRQTLDSFHPLRKNSVVAGYAHCNDLFL